jgi:NADPH:quinone reductase-like Zn-dependent oxidoreductase
MMTSARSNSKATAPVATVMRAVRLHAAGDPAHLVYEELETPRPGPGEALVRVHAAAITRDELTWPVDRLPAVPSYEFSGVVAAVGPAVETVAIGDAVYALSGFDRNGAAAEYTVVPAAVLAAKPRTRNHVESAAIPLAGLSAWQGLFEHGGLKQGQRVLIHGAAGGVGSFAVQLARLRGAYVIGTASTANVERVRTLGAEEVIDHTQTRFEDAVGSVDVVFDTVGGDRLRRSFAVVRAGGRIVSVAEEPLAEYGRERGIGAAYFVVEPNRGQLVEMARLVDCGDLQPIIDRVFPFAAAREAFECSLGPVRFGKIVIRLAAGDE